MERQFKASGEDTTIKQKLIEIEFAKYIRVSRCQLSARDCLKRTASYCMKFCTDRYALSTFPLVALVFGSSWF